jgi:hypothetical protein
MSYHHWSFLFALISQSLACHSTVYRGVAGL